MRGINFWRLKEEVKNMSAIQPFAESLWIVDGPNVRDMGIMFTTRMTIVKLSDGSVWVESPVPLPFVTLKQIAELGPIRYIVATTQRHVWRLEGWHGLFPEAQLWAPPTTPFTLKKKPLPYAGILMDTPYQGWANDLDQLTFKGSPWLKEVLFFHKESRTVIMGDLIQAYSMVKGKPLRNALMKLEGVTSPGGAVGLEIKLTFTNRNLARQSLEELLSWDFDRLIIAHGSCLEKDAKRFVVKAFQWLVR
jgi:hypothetical protein